LVCVGAVGAMLVGVDEAEVGLVCFLVGAGWILRVGHGCMSVYGWVLVWFVRDRYSSVDRWGVCVCRSMVSRLRWCGLARLVVVWVGG